MKKYLIFLMVLSSLSFANADLDPRVESDFSNTDDIENAEKSAISKFVNDNSKDTGGGFPIVETRTPYVAANKKFCISGDCHELINSYLATAGALTMSLNKDGSVNLALKGSNFRATAPKIDFDMQILPENIFDAEDKTIYPKCEEGCYSVKIHARKADAILILFVEKNGKKKNILFINASVKSEADAGSLHKIMDDYYEKHGKSLEHTESDPKDKEDKNDAQNSEDDQAE